MIETGSLRDCRITCALFVKRVRLGVGADSIETRIRREVARIGGAEDRDACVVGNVERESRIAVGRRRFRTGITGRVSRETVPDGVDAEKMSTRGDDRAVRDNEAYEAVR